MKKRNILRLFTFSSVVSPVIFTIACASRGGTSGDFNTTKVDELMKESKEFVASSQTSYEKVQKQIYYFLYNKEQKNSIKLQKDYFAWERHKLEQDIKDPQKGDPALQVEIYKNIDIPKDKEDEYSQVLKDNIDRWNKLNDKIDRKDWDKDEKLYESKSLGSDYPELLVPIDIIKEKQTKIYEDRKEAHIKSFGKRAEGEDDWFKKLPETFGQASSDQQAINHLVFQQISPNSLGRYSYSINDTFTQEQYDWAKDNDFKFFSFLENAKVKASTSKVDDKVYFIGNNSKDSSIKSKKPELDQADSQILFRHFLIKAVPSATGPDLPWTIDIADIKNLFQFESFGKDAQGNDLKQAYQYIPQVFQTWKNKVGGTTGTILEGVNDLDDKFLQFYSNNSEGTKKIGGSLGTSKPLDFVAKMVPGFQLGVMKYMEDANASLITNPSSGNDILTKLVTKLQEAYEEILNEINKTPTDVKGQDELKQFLEEIDDAKQQEIVGNKLREVFDDNGTKGIDQFYYPLSERRFVVISSNGIHIVAYSQPFDIDKQNDGLQKMADDQSTALDEFKYIENVQQYYSEWRQFLEIVNDPSFYDPSKDTGFLKDKKDQLNLEDSKTLKEAFEEATKFANQKIKNEVFSPVQSVSRNYNWLLEQFDKELRENSDTSYDPEELYKKAKDFGGVK